MKHVHAMQPLDSSESRHLNITPSAVERLRHIQQMQNRPQILRVVIDPGGCSGFQYQLSLLEKVDEQDIVFIYDDIKTATDEASLSLIDGVIIDYIEEMMGSAFVMKNPKATAACGCGNSFSVF